MVSKALQLLKLFGLPQVAHHTLKILHCLETLRALLIDLHLLNACIGLYGLATLHQLKLDFCGQVRFLLGVEGADGTRLGSVAEANLLLIIHIMGCI